MGLKPMASVPHLSRTEQLIGATADLIHDFALSYDSIADTIPRDAPGELSADWIPAGAEPSLDTLYVPARGNPAEELPLAEWVAIQAAWYDQCHAEGSELVASAIRRIGHAAEMHRCSTVAEVVARSPLFQGARLDDLATPDDRPGSFLAELIDAEVDGYLRLGGDLARLVAWTLLRLAEEAEHYQADTEREFIEGRREAEAEAADSVDDAE